MNKIISFTIFYIIIIIIQILFTVYNTRYRVIETDLDKKIKFNIEHYDELTLFLEKKLKERIKLLVENKMTFDEWIKYNQQNLFVEFKGFKYYFFIFERGEDKNEIITIQNLVHANPEYIGLEWRDVMKNVNEEFVFLKQNTNTDLVKNFMEISKKDITKMQYYWPDPIEQTPVKKESFCYTISEGEDYGETLIGIGMDLKNLDKENRLYYIDYTYFPYIILISIITFVVGILIIIFIDNYSYIYRPYVFLFFTNLYLLYFLNKSEYQGKTENEIKKIDQINSSTLGVSFLVGVNTFIITSLTKYSKELFIQSASVFSISVILLLLASLKVTDTITIYELISERISNQLIFNFSVLLNIFVVGNYLISVIRRNYSILSKGINK